MSKAAKLMVEHVTKRFEGIVALNDISFSVAPGEIHGIIGPNGAGKTTMFNLITGIYHPTEGNLMLNEASLVGKKTHETAAMGVARTFQNIRLFGELSVYDNIITSCQKHLSYSLLDGIFRTGKFRREEKEIAAFSKEILQELGLWELRNQAAGNLPYGQQRRLEIARAIVTEPTLLLLDEPVSGLDPKATAEMYALIEKLNREDGITVIMISHDIGAAVKYATHILHIGDAVFFGTKTEYLQSPQGRLFAAEKGGGTQ